jgi:TM2 domain-containing membrane protein YozV
MIKSFGFFLFLFISINLFANQNDNFNKAEIRFIKELYQSGRYFDCIAEIGKLQFSEINPKLEYFKYVNYYLAEQYSTVIINYKTDRSSDEMLYNSLFLLSGSYFKKGMYHESYEILKDLEYDKLPAKLVFTMFLRRVESLTLMGDQDNIKNEIYKSELLIRDDFNFVKLREELELYNKAGLKSRACSAFMSAIIPGSGQIYSGYYIDGIISFLSVAASAAGGWYMYDKGHKGISYSLFFFSGLFYGGNIFSAYNAAEKRNYKTLQNRYESISSQHGRYNPGDFIDIERVFN